MLAAFMEPQPTLNYTVLHAHCSRSRCGGLSTPSETSPTGELRTIALTSAWGGGLLALLLLVLITLQVPNQK
jgi:hypothetical protein